MKSKKIKKLKYIVSVQKGKVPKKMNLTNTGNLPIYLAMDYLREEPKHISYVPDFEKYILVDENEILLLWDGSNAGEFMWSKKGILSSTMAVIKPKINIHKSFLFYQFKELERYLKDITVGMGIPHVNPQEFLNYSFLIPSFQEQTAIANYLDHKTAEIDELINKKEQLLKLYEEEKTAIINQAVTKGINPDVKMKDSGIDWLGEIPEHWEVKKLKYVGNIKYGLGQPPKLKPDGLPLIRATNIFSGRIDEKDMIFVDPDDIPYDRDPVLKENDIIVVRSGAYTADSAIIPKKYDGAITGYDMVIRCSSNYNSKFVSSILLSNYVLNSQLIPQSLRAAQPHLNREELGETLVLVPQTQEQANIVNHIEIEINRINTKSEKTKKLIDLLGEYKQSLISEVVTGKIKVSNYD